MKNPTIALLIIFTVIFSGCGGEFGTLSTANKLSQELKSYVKSTDSFYIYTNTKWGYELTCPDSWVVDEEFAEDGVLFLRSPEQQEMLDQNIPVRMFDVEIRVFNSTEELPNNKTQNLSLEDWVANEEKKGFFADKTATQVDGITAIQGAMIGAVSDFVIFVERNTRIYQLTVQGEMNEEKESILESFNFI